MTDWLKGTLVERRQWTEDLFSLRFAAPLADFKAGQFIRIALDIDGERVGRPYSLVNAPGEPLLGIGVTGDGRRYDNVVALRAVETIDFMTARWAHLPYEFLDNCSRRIINEIPRIARVVYDITGKPPGTIEWE